MKHFHFCWVLLILLSGCASLTKTQVNAVNQFAETSKNFSAYPSKVLSELTAIRKSSSLLFNSGLSDAAAIEEKQVIAYQDYKKDIALDKKVDITFKIIDKYAQSLALLSSDKHVENLRTQANVFGTDLDSLVTTYNNLPGANQLPTGIGGAVKKLVVLAGSQYIRNKQAKEIKKFVPAADTIIGAMTNNLIDFLRNTHIDALINGIEVKLKNDFIAYAAKPTNAPALLVANEQYIGLLERVDKAKLLRDQTIQATQKLRGAHQALLAAINTKRSLQEMISDVKTFYEDVKEIKNTIQQINNIKNNQ